jgi:hypothetical protein
VLLKGKLIERTFIGLAISTPDIHPRGQPVGNDIGKAHGLGYLFPPKSASEDEPEWTFEAWNWLLCEALELRRSEPPWFGLPAMMRIVLSTPHVLQRLDFSTRPYNFLLCPLIDSVTGYPAGADPNHFTLIRQFTKHRERW